MVAGCVAIQHSQGCDTASGSPAIPAGARDIGPLYDRLGPLHDLPQAATRSGHDHDTAQCTACVHGLSALRATWVHHTRS